MARRQAGHTGGALAAIVVALAWLLASCGEGGGRTACLPEDVQRCACGDGRAGFQVCALDGGRYGTCDCELDASPYLPEPPDGAVEAAAPADGGLSFMSPCSTAPGAPQCPAGTSCDAFPAKGPRCSKPCSLATDCPPPSPGCNLMGICKAP